MIKKLLLLFYIFFSITTYAKLIESDDIFQGESFTGFKVSPDGEYIISKVNMDDSWKIIAFKNTSKNAIEVFNISLNNGRNYIFDYDWIDNNTIYVNYRVNNRIIPPRIIDFKFKDEDFDISHFDLKIKGLFVNPLPKVEDEVLYAIMNEDDEGLDLHRVNLRKLEDLEYSEQTDYFDDLEPLNEGFDNAVSFWVYEEQLQLVKEEYEGNSYYYIKQSEKNDWNKFYEILKLNEEELSENNKKTDVFNPVAKLNESQVVVVSNFERDKAAVLIYDVERKKFTDVLYESPFYDVVSAGWNAKKNVLNAVYYIDKGTRKVKYLDEGTLEHQRYLKNEVGIDGVYLVDSSTDSVHNIVFASDSANPGKYYYYNSETKRIKFLQDSFPELHDFKFSKGKYLKTINENGHLVEGYLFSTNERKPSPLIVFPHGGPIGVQDLNEFDREVQFLVNRGYSVLKVNFRGSSGYGKEFKDSGRGEFGRGIESDIDLVVQEALKQTAVDKEKVCIYGQSYGGYSALISVLLNKSQYKCAISAFGVTDLPLAFFASNVTSVKEVQRSIENVIGNLDENYDSLIERSPVYKAREINVPILLLAGKQDEIASYEHSNRMRYVLEKHGKSVQFASYETEHGHKYWIGDRHQYLLIVEFLDNVFGVARSYEDRDKRVYANEMYLLGEMFRVGKYVDENKELAEKYLRKAYELRHDDAASSLRKMGIYDL